MRYLVLALALSLVAACGPSAEDVGCCECLAGTEPPPSMWHGTCVIDGDAHASITEEDAALEYCLDRIHSEEGLFTALACWSDDAPRSEGSHLCATACAASRDDLMRAHRTQTE